MNDYIVYVYFEGYNDPETSFHYDCENASEAIAKAMDALEPVWVGQISDIDCRIDF